MHLEGKTKDGCYMMMDLSLGKIVSISRKTKNFVKSSYENITIRSQQDTQADTKP